MSITKESKEKRIVEIYTKKKQDIGYLMSELNRNVDITEDDKRIVINVLRKTFNKLDDTQDSLLVK